jgi:hypothetical protein
MVMMISDTTGAERAVSMASLLKATPMTAVARIASSAASGSGSEDGEHAAQHHEFALREIHDV